MRHAAAGEPCLEAPGQHLGIANSWAGQGLSLWHEQVTVVGSINSTYSGSGKDSGGARGSVQAAFTSRACSHSFHIKPNFPNKRRLPFLSWLLGSQLSSALGLHLPYSTARSKDLQRLCALGSATEMSSGFLWHGVGSALVASGKMLFAFFLLLYLYHARGPQPVKR